VKDLLKLTAVVAVLAVAAYWFVSLGQRKGFGLKLGEAAPAFHVQALDGSALTLGGYRGHTVLINLWASWCPPCVSEMPGLERLHRKLKPEGLNVLGVSVDKEDADARKIVDSARLTFTIGRDPEGVMSNAYRATGYPETYLVDRNGIVRDVFIGPADWDSPETVARVRAVMDQR
jgi:peroxiredoxin